MKKVEYVLWGRKIKRDQYKRFIRGNTAYLMGKDRKPTRDINEALVIVLDNYQEASWGMDENTALIFACGMEWYLIKKGQEQMYLNNYPLPRKAIGKKIREAVYAKFGGRCAYCGREIALKDMQVDHIVPHMYHKGEDAEENYNPSCPVCNRVKSANTIEEFRASIRNCARIHHGRKPNSHIYADSDKIAEYYGLLGGDWKDKAIKFYFEKGNQKP